MERLRGACGAPLGRRGPRLEELALARGGDVLDHLVLVQERERPLEVLLRHEVAEAARAFPGGLVGECGGGRGGGGSQRRATGRLAAEVAQETLAPPEELGFQRGRGASLLDVLGCDHCSARHTRGRRRRRRPCGFRASVCAEQGPPRTCVRSKLVQKCRNDVFRLNHA